MRDGDGEREQKQKAIAAQRRKAEFAENWSWVIASLVLIVVLQTQWKPQSDWTVAIKWVVLMSPIYYSASSFIRIIRLFVLKDDERW